MKARILNADSPDWADLLREATHDFYHLPAYVALEAAQDGGAAHALLVDDGTSQLLLPLVVRTIPGADRTDATSPYGYPGPVIHGPAGRRFEEEAWQAGLAALREAGVVALFVRFHPLLNGPPPDGVGTTILHGHTVSIALNLPEAALWHQLRHNHRRDIRKAVQRGLIARPDPRFELYQAFRDLYRATMERHAAADFYFFSDAYFDGLRDALGERLHLIAVEAEGEVAAAGLFVETDGIVQYHLGGTQAAYVRAEPSKLLIHFASGWAKQRGNRRLHLGGGVGGADDSLLYFKGGFSSLRHPYRTLRVVLDPAEYRRLVLARDPGSEATDLGGFFPAYRTE